MELEVQMIFFTSDTHFYHKNIIKYSNRPFADVYEMNEALIYNWNKTVSKNDTVYHLGDFVYGRMATERDVRKIFNELNGYKCLIVGNHDSKMAFDLSWGWIKDYHELYVNKTHSDRQKIILSHYSFRTWNGAGRGSWMLYGHSHGSLPQPPGKTFDVGVDCQNYTPISYDEVEERMNKVPTFAEDHHARKEE
jgi:calcineurin-like phosphoesterase family protein